MKKNFISNHCSSCEQCNKSNLVELKSSVNFTYLYCDYCGYNKEIAFKNFTKDSILKSIKNTLESLCENLLLNLDVEIYKTDDSINLFINKIKIDTFNLEYSLSKKDCNYLKNTILYLVYDYTDTENININFYIN